jgi:hypothetical protein
MRLQLIRNHKARVVGVAVLFGKRRVLRSCVMAQGAEVEYQRICDGCSAREPVVFCRTHALYLCEGCLPWHTEVGECRYISMAVARELVEGAA